MCDAVPGISNECWNSYSELSCLSIQILLCPFNRHAQNFPWPFLSHARWSVNNITINILKIRKYLVLEDNFWQTWRLNCVLLFLQYTYENLKKNGNKIVKHPIMTVPTIGFLNKSNKIGYWNIADNNNSVEKLNREINAVVKGERRLKDHGR